MQRHGFRSALSRLTQRACFSVTILTPLSGTALRCRIRKGAAVTPDMQTEQVAIDSIKPNAENPRVHSCKQIRQIAQSIKSFGFRFPILIDQDSRLISGHARVEACKLIGMDRVPALRASDLSEDQRRALMIADNRLTEIGTWDDKLLGENLKILSDTDLDFDIESIGFDYGEIEQRILAEEGDPVDVEDIRSNDLPDPNQIASVARPGDLWILGEGESAHRVLCADCTDQEAYARLFGDRLAAMVFTDPPYNLSAKSIGRVCAGEHGDFEMAAGEMNAKQFTQFLASVMERLCAATKGAGWSFPVTSAKNAARDTTRCSPSLSTSPGAPNRAFARRNS